MPDKAKKQEESDGYYSSDDLEIEDNEKSEEMESLVQDID